MILVFLIALLVFSILALVFALNMMVSLVRDKVPFVPTPQWAIDWMCQHPPLPIQGGGQGVVYDLGCGDARVLVALKKRFHHITAIGYERNWWPFIIAKARARKTGVTVRRANFYTADLKDADIVFCFLIHSVMPKVEKLLRTKLKPGTTVYSYGFAFPNWSPVDRIVNPTNPGGSKINVYRQSQR